MVLHRMVSGGNHLRPPRFADGTVWKDLQMHRGGNTRGELRRLERLLALSTSSNLPDVLEFGKTSLQLRHQGRPLQEQDVGRTCSAKCSHLASSPIFLALLEFGKTSAQLKHRMRRYASTIGVTHTLASTKAFSTIFKISPAGRKHAFPRSSFLGRQ